MDAVIATGGPTPDPLLGLKNLTRAMTDAAMGRTRQWAALVDDGYNYVFNNQLADKERRYGHIPVQMNAVWPSVKQEMALLAQRRPKIETQGQEVQDARAAAFWRGLLQFMYDKVLKMAERCREAALDGKVTGWYVAKIEWDDHASWDASERRWHGLPNLSVIDSRRFGMDPNAERYSDAQYVVYQQDMPVEEALRLWGDTPERKAIIRKAMQEPGPELGQRGTAPAAQMDAESEREGGVESRVQGKLVSLLDAARTRTVVTIPETEGEWDPRAQVVTITEVYFRDAETKTEKVTEVYSGDELLAAGVIEEQFDTDEQGNKMPTGKMVVANPDAEEFRNIKRKYQKGEPLSRADWPTKDAEDVEVPKFPNGRAVFKVNEEILNPDEDDQVWDRSRWPFEIGVNHLLPHVPQGLNGVEMPRQMQDFINVFATKMLDWVMYFGDAVDVFEDGAQKDSESKGGSRKARLPAGRKITLNQGRMNGYKREGAPPLPEGLIRAFELFVARLQDLAGIHNPDLGARSKGDATATEIATLQQSTAVSVGLQMMYMDEWIVRCMEQVAELLAKEMPVGEMVRIVGEGQGAATEVVEFTQDFADFKFDITLNVGTALPWDKDRRRRELMDLKTQFPQNPEIDRMLLEVYDVGDVESVMQAGNLYAQFLQYLEQLRQQQELEAEGAQAGAGQGAPATEMEIPA